MTLFVYRGHTLKNRTRRTNDWSVAWQGRVRWGTLDEIKADVDCLVTYGYLPREKTSWA